MKKKCSKCGEKKELDDFHVNRLTPDGRQPSCKVCRNKNNNKYIRTDWLKMVIG